MNFFRTDAPATVVEDGADGDGPAELSVWSLGTAATADEAQRAPETFGHMHLLERGSTKGLRVR